MVLAAAAQPYTAPEASGRFRLLVTGGSQGARVMADVVPPAVEKMAPDLRARLDIVQQARGEDETARGARLMRGSASKPRLRRSSPTCRRASRRRI